MKDLVFQRQLQLTMKEDIIIDNLTLTNDSIIKLFYNLATNSVRIQHLGVYSKELDISEVQEFLSKIRFTTYMEPITFKNQLESRFKDYNNEEHNYLLENSQLTIDFIKNNYHDLMFMFEYELNAYNAHVHSLLHNQAAIILNQVSELGLGCNEKKFFAMSTEVQRLLGIYARDKEYYNNTITYYKSNKGE